MVLRSGGEAPGKGRTKTSLGNGAVNSSGSLRTSMTSAKAEALVAAWAARSSRFAWAMFTSPRMKRDRIDNNPKAITAMATRASTRAAARRGLSKSRRPALARKEKRIRIVIRRVYGVGSDEPRACVDRNQDLLARLLPIPRRVAHPKGDPVTHRAAADHTTGRRKQNVHAAGSRVD